MNDMMTICRTTYTRILRTRSLYLLLVAVLVLVAVAHLYNDLTMGRQKELMFDAGAALLALVGLLTALIAVFDIARDLREKLVMTLLSKPLGRGQYLLGKCLGVVWLGTVILVVLTAGVMVILKLETDVWRLDFMQVALTTWAALIMATAVAVLFASFLSEIPAALLTVAVYWLGHATEAWFRGKHGALQVVFGLLPNFSLLDFKTDLGNGLDISWSLIVMSMGYAIVYSAALLSLATVAFHKRDLA